MTINYLKHKTNTFDYVFRRRNYFFVLFTGFIHFSYPKINQQRKIDFFLIMQTDSCQNNFFEVMFRCFCIFKINNISKTQTKY